MRVSKEGIAFIKRMSTADGRSLRTLQKNEYDNLVIGYGHFVYVGHKSLWAAGITQADATKVLKDDLREIEEELTWRVKYHCPLEQHKFDALASLIHHTGIMAFLLGPIPEALKEGNLNAIPELFFEYTKVKKGGRDVDNSQLVSRRKAESRLFTEGYLNDDIQPIKITGRKRRKSV